jgi:hypothetical protein
MQTEGRSVVTYTRWIAERLGAKELNIFLLLICLNSIEFYFLMPDDSHRADDALSLREDYISEYGNIENIMSTPTVLEVLASLAERSTIMDNDPAWKWFMLFLENLGFDYLTDKYWNSDSERFVNATVRKWLDRRFDKNGMGSPFRGNGTYDVSRTSMWYALQWYLSNSFGEGHI